MHRVLYGAALISRLKASPRRTPISEGHSRFVMVRHITLCTISRFTDVGILGCTE